MQKTLVEILTSQLATTFSIYKGYRADLLRISTFCCDLILPVFDAALNTHVCVCVCVGGCECVGGSETEREREGGLVRVCVCVSVCN